jgi:hypothetical protein
MSSLPWMCQSHVADAKIRKYETALQAIAGLDWNTMTSDQALANLRNVITIARDAIERQGLTGSPWEWIADTRGCSGRATRLRSYPRAASLSSCSPTLELKKSRQLIDRFAMLSTQGHAVLSRLLGGGSLTRAASAWRKRTLLRRVCWPLFSLRTNAPVISSMRPHTKDRDCARQLWQIR